MRPDSDDDLAFVIDLRRAAMDEVAREVAAASSGAFVPRVLPSPPEGAIATVALLVDGADAPVLLPIAPTRDVRYLDALARLLRFAVLRGAPVREIARAYGTDYERSLELPRWSRGELDAAARSRLPPAVAAALR